MSNTSDTAVDKILANLNQEFKTPLTLMLAALERASRRADVPSGLRPDIATSQENAQRLLQLVTRLLDLSKADQGNLRSRLELVDVSGITTEIVDRYRPVAHRLELKLNSDLPIVENIYIDPKIWSDIVLNLLSNATHFTMKGGTVGVRVFESSGHVVLEVSDTGLGVPEDEIDNLFQRFYHVHESDGMGIGLALVKDYVELLHGTIEVKSVVGQGSTFTVRVPNNLEGFEGARVSQNPLGDGTLGRRIDAQLKESLRWVPDLEDQDTASDVANITRLRVQRPNTVASTRPRVIVADANQSVRQLIADTLAPFYEVVQVDGGNALIERLRANECNLIVLDSSLPDMSSAAVVKAIRDDFNFRHIPILIVSDRQPGAGSLASDLFGDDYVTKPFTSSEVLARTKNLIEKSRLIMEKDAMMRQAQRMEALGQLTGGIAHDFSNLLVAIMGNLDVAQMKAGDPVSKFINNAMQAARRGSKLTNHLLSFSQKRGIEIKTLNANEVISSMGDILSRTLGGMIGVSTRLSKQLWATEADAGQLELALLNVALNARDAMARGGDLTITTENITRDAADGVPTDYVRIAIADTGVGMAEEVKTKAFDEFFTTKGPGEGSGLGLTQVKNMVTEIGGIVDLVTKPGHGTTVEILLPRKEGEKLPEAEPIVEEPVNPDNGQKLRVLVVDDDDSVREVVLNMLGELNHQVALANSGRQALSILETGEFDLLLADYAMPGMTGSELVSRVRALYPSIRVLFMTGYADTKQLSDSKEIILRKPFELPDLVVKIARAMKEERRPAQSAQVIQLRRP